MLLVILYAVLTIGSVVFALRKQKPFLLTTPIIALFGYVLIKVIMVPMPLWETIQFIFGLR